METPNSGYNRVCRPAGKSTSLAARCGSPTDHSINLNSKTGILWVPELINKDPPVIDSKLLRVLLLTSKRALWKMKERSLKKEKKTFRVRPKIIHPTVKATQPPIPDKLRKTSSRLTPINQRMWLEKRWRCKWQQRYMSILQHTRTVFPKREI